MKTTFRPLAALFFALVSAISISAAPPVELSRGRADRLLDVDLHLLIGGSYMTDNYKSCFPEISDINTSMRPAAGVGVGCRFNIRRFLGLGTELNFTRNAFNVDMAIVGSSGQSVSNVFQRNTYYKVDIPVYMSLMFDISAGVRWNIDAGLYYAYGLGGKQKNNIYDTRSNELGQLMMSVTPYDTDFYNDSHGFLNSYDRGDIGLHLATALTFLHHFRIGLRAHLGMSNLANTTGIIRPSCHSMDYMATLGWQF